MEDKRGHMTTAFASVDLGGTNTAFALGGSDGTLLGERIIPTQSSEGPERVLERVGAAVKELAEEAGLQPAALGMGLPGLVDRQRGVTRFLPNVPTKWRDVPVARMLGDVVACPVYLLNDVRCATLGELTFGRGREVSTMAFFAIGTGIGGGVAIDRKLHLGRLGAAGELGHQTILPDGPLCGCGNHGCLETLASGPAIAAEGARLMNSGLAPALHEITGGRVERITPKEMAAAAEAGDDAVREAILRAARYLGIGVANTVLTIHPELVVLGGGVAAIGPMLVDTVRQTMLDRIGMFPVDDVRVEVSALGDKAGLYGGIALAARGGDI